MSSEEKCDLCGKVVQIQRTTSPSGHSVKWCPSCKGQVHDLEICTCSEAEEYRQSK